MGHTIPPKRTVIYQKLADLLRFAGSLREPYRTRFEILIKSVYRSISSIVYTNSLDDEEMMIYAMLKELDDDFESKDKVRRCLAILLAG